MSSTDLPLFAIPGLLILALIAMLLIKRIIKKKEINVELQQKVDETARVNWSSYLAVLDVQPTNRFSISVWENSKNDFGGDLKAVTLRATITRLLDKIINCDKLFELEIVTFNSIGEYRHDQEKIRSYYKEQVKDEPKEDSPDSTTYTQSPADAAVAAMDNLTNVVNNLKKGSSNYYNGSPITQRTIEQVNKFIEDTKNNKK